MKRASVPGFTLIELLIVVAIIAILAAIAVPNFLQAQTRSKVSRVVSDQRTLTVAVKAYHTDFNRPPPNEVDLSPTGLTNFQGPLIRLSTPVAYVTSSIIPDPFGNRVLEQDPRRNVDKGFYLFFSLHPDEPLVAFALGPAVGPSNLEIIKAHQFAIYSTGPEGITEFDKIGQATGNPQAALGAQAAQFLTGQGVYDPSNGTISPGDIIRTAKGSLENVN